MDDFIFDLQRFDTVSTVLEGYDKLLVTIDGEPKTIESSGNNSINITLTTEGDATQNAAISLSAGDGIFVEDTLGRRWNYNLTTAGTNGIVVTIGSDSTANVGLIDSGDKFSVSDTVTNSLNSAATYSMTSKGLLVDYNSTVKGYDGFVNDNALTSVSLTSSALDTSTANFYRVVEVDNNVLNIDDKDDFAYDTAKGYTGVYAMDTDSDTPSIYARLVSTNSVPYRLSSVGSGDSSLSTINISSSDVLTTGISFTKNFAGDNNSTPTIIAGKTTFHVDSASDAYFTVSGGNNSSPVSLTSNVDVSLIGGAITANENQTIKSGTYTISGYADSKNANDGITISSDGKLSDIDIGESFVLNGSTYRRTNIGYLKDSDTVPLAVSNTVSNIDASELSSAATYSNFHDYTEVITLGSSTGTLPAIIAYGETALATLKTATISKTTRYSLASDQNAEELHLNEWGGVKLNGQSIWLNGGLVANSTAPLKIMTSKATVGVIEANSGNTYLADNLIATNTNDYFQNIKRISLAGGTLVAGSGTNDAYIGRPFILGSANNVSINKGKNPVTIFADESGATLSQASGAATVGRGRFSDTNGTNGATIDSDGNTWLPSKQSFTLYDASGSNSSACSGSASFIYGKTSGVSVTGFTSGTEAKFKVGSNNYTLTANKVLTKASSSNSNAFSIWTKTDSNYSNGVYRLSDDDFHDYLKSDGSITISSTNASMTAGEEQLYISSVSTVLTDTVYGGLTRLSSGGYILNKNSEGEPNAANASLESVFIDNKKATVLPVNFTGNFVNTNVSVGNSSDTVAFKVLNDNDKSNFTVSHNDDVSLTEISGAKQISLISGSILTNDSSQTVLAGDYSIRSDSISGTDGIIVAQSIGSGDTVQIIGDIDYGESFYIGNVKYSRDILGLTATDTTGTSFYNVSLVGDNTDIANTEKAVAAMIGDLINPTSKRTMVTSSLHADSVNYIFGINTSSDTISSLVVNDSDPPTIRYGDLIYISEGRQYSLGVNTENSTTPWEHLNIISISSGDTTVDSFFTSNGKSPVTIMTGGGASFLVNNTSDDGYFTVRGTATSPAIGGAAELTLLNGTITAVPTVTSGDTVANQVINLGTRTVHPVLQVATNTKVGYSDSIGTISGSYSTTESSGTGFTLNSATYSVIGGNGMNFLVGDSDVTITNLERAATANADAFYYDDKYYSIRSAGFVRGDAVGLGNKLWSKTNNHKLENATVAVSDAGYDANWVDIAEIDRDTRVASIPADLDGSVAYVDLDYLYTYGRLTGSNGAYSLTTDEATATVKSIYIPKNSVSSLSIESDFKNITIDSQYATVAVPTVSGNYQVYLNNNESAAMSLSGGAKQISLISGTVTADKNLTVSVPKGENRQAVKALENSIITLTASGTNSSVALDVGESFNLSTSNYTLGALGLTKNTSILPSVANSDNQNTFAISAIDDGDWYNMLEVGEHTLTISSSVKDKTLVVDSSPIPTKQYASISNSDNGLYLNTVSSADALDSSDIILITTTNNVTVANANAFKNRTIVGKNSNAVFSVTGSSSNFVVSDSKNGASIANATGIIQTDGTITTKDTKQNITVGSYKVAYSSGDGINVAISSGAASIGSLNKGDSFTVASLTGSNTKYSLSSDARIRSGNKMWNQTVNGSVAISDLFDTTWTDWKGILSATSGSVTINSNDLKNSLTNNTAYIVESSNTVSSDDVIYGTITTVSGGLSMSTVGRNSEALENISIARIDKPISLDSSFASATIKGSNATLNVLNDTGIFVLSTLSGGYFAVTEADELNLSSGTIKSTSTTQTIHAGDYDIYPETLLGSDSSIYITNNNGKVSVGGLNEGEIFGVTDSDGNTATYKYTKVGIITLDDNNKTISDRNTVETSSGVFSVGTGFSREILTLTNNELYLSNQDNSAVVLDNYPSPTITIAELDYDSVAPAFTIKSSKPSNPTITSVNLGDNNVAVNTNFDTTVKTNESSYTSTINGDLYKAVDSALSIQSGVGDNQSSLIKGTVALTSDGASSVKTYSNKAIDITSGDITVSADSENAVTITGLNNGDIFTVDESNYSVKGMGLLSENKIWKYDNYADDGVELSGASGLTVASNWNYFVNISESALSIPVSGDFPATLSQWIILSEDLDKNHGTLTSVSNSGYSIAINPDIVWSDTDTISINEVTVSLPTDFLRKSIKGELSGAVFKVGTASSPFVVTDGGAGATIANATKISQTSGTIALPQGFDQTIIATAADSLNYTVASDSANAGDGVTVIIKDGAASIGALSVVDNQDSFKINGYSYQMLSNGSIWRSKGSSNTFWLGTVADNGTVGVEDLLNTAENEKWGNSITISGGILTIDSSEMAKAGSSLGFVVDADNYTTIYGKLTASASSYSLDGSNVTGTLSGITLGDSAQFNFTRIQDKYIDIPITAGNTIFAATNATGNFTVDYTKAGLGTAASLSTDAVGVSLIGGGWNLNSTIQTVTAANQVIQLGASGAVQASIVTGGVEVTGLDAAGEIVKINNRTYQLNSSAVDDSGISVSLTSDSVATVKDITDDDNFAITESGNTNTFIKKSAGFIKKNSTNNYLWINSAEVTVGAAVTSLNGNDANTWAQVATVDGSITINKNAATAVLIDSVDSLSSIYGAMTVDDGTYTLSSKKGAVSANAKPTAITITSVDANLDSYYAKVPIYAAGASFVVNALTSADSLFTVGATTSNATLGNVSEVSLVSGTISELTNASTVKGANHTVAAAANSTINIGLNDTLFTFSGLDDGEGITFDNTAYVYKDVGVVKNNQTLYVNSSLRGAITSDSLTGANYQSMFASDGSTLTLQSGANGVFVDSIGNDVSKVYAFQTYDQYNKLYTFNQNIIDNYTINAAAMASGASINAAFKGQVITPATGTFIVNGKSYAAVNALTIDTTADSSTLNKGTATLAAGVSVAMTNGDSIGVTSGNGIQVSAAPTSYTLLELDNGDVFTIDGYSYSMLSDNYLFRTKDNTTELCRTSVTGGALASSIIGSDDYWDNYITLEKDNTLNLSGDSLTSGIVVSNGLSAIYADLIVNGKRFTLEKIGNSNTSDISKISLGADTSTLTADFAATVRTTSGTGTYTVNDSPYTAKNSELVIVTDANNSSITSGVITMNNSPDITTSSNHTVSGTVAELDVAKMSFTPSTGNSFTLDNVAYSMNSVGLTKNNSYLWTKSSTESFVLPAADSLWSDMMSLTKDGTLNLKNGVTADSVVVLDNGRTKRMALLNYSSSDNAYTLTSEGGNSIATIQLGDSADSILSLTDNFESSIATGNGVYKINGNIYKGNGLTITTDDNNSALYAGTVSLSAGTVYNSVADSLNSYEVTGGDGMTATATNASITTLGNLNSGDTFITGSKYYKVLGNQTLVQTDSDGGNPSKIYKDLIVSGALNTANIIDDNFLDFVEMGSDGVLDLTSALGSDGWSALVLSDDSSGDPTIRIAQISYTTEGGYKLETTSDGDPSTLTSVKLGSAVKTFSTAIDTTVSIGATGTYNINGQPFTAQNDLKIAATNGNAATLLNGAVTLGENVEITTRRTNNGTQTDETIKTTSGTTTVTVDETAGTVTISGLNPGEKFTFGGNEYTMTPIGLQNGTKLNPTVTTTASVVTTDLDLSDDTKWLTLLQMTGGALVLNSSTASNVFVVDMTSSTEAVKYGTLTKSGDVYTLTQDDSDAKLASIALEGVRATFGAKASDVDITTNAGTDYETTFSVTATDNFTVNAASGGNPIVSDVSNVSGIYLSAGTIVAPANIPVTASGYAIKATNGDMNISIVDGKAQISELEKDDTFTVDDTTEYKMVDIGLLDVTNQQLRTEVEDTYTIGETFTRIIAVDGTNLSLSNETKSANVYDSISAPKTQLGTLTVSKGVKTLAAVGNGATAMQSVDIAAGDNLNVSFDTRVNSPIGSVTVNGNTYAGTTALAIDSDGTTSTLYAGTITLDIATPSATDSSKNALAREVGTFTATAASGKFTTLTNLDNAESFTYGGATYTQNIPGLINTTSNVICTDILANTTITLADLSSATWNNFTAPVDGVLDISALDSNNIIYDNATTPTTKYATLTVADGKKTLTGEENAAASISEVVVAAGDDLTVDFVTQIDSPIGSVTVNGNTYAGTTEILIDSDGTTSTLYDGTVRLNGTNNTATDSSGNALTRESGSFTAIAVEGAFTTIKGLHDTESFTYGGATYVQSAQGLRNGALICRDLTGTTINLSELDGTWDNMLAPVDGVLDISNFSGNAYVYDSATNPTTQLATLTTADGVKTLTNNNNAADSIIAVQIAAGDTLAVDFATNVNAPIGSVKVNNKDYVGTTALVIRTTKKSSTLYSGTVSLANKDATVRTTGKTSITYTTEGGDGLNVAVDNSGESEAVTFSGLTTGDTFTIGDNAYKVSAVAPINPSGELWTGGDYANGITLAQINDATNWTPMIAAPDAALSVDAETLTEDGELIVVDNVDDPTAIYGDLTKSGDAYTLTRPTTANADLTSIAVDGVAIEIAPNYAGVTFTANDSAFSDVTLADAEKSFTLDATNTPSLSDNVSSLTLTAGTIDAAVNQVVTTGNNVITPTAINGDMVIGTATIGGIVQGDAFTLNDKAYVMLNTGLFNDTDNKLVTSGIDDGTLTISDIVETQLLAISNGELDLTTAAAGNSLVVDTVESPANVYGALNKNKNTYKLDKRSDGITSITLPDATSTLTTDIAATVNAPSSSNTYTVNSKVYKANNSALTIASDGTTSTLTDGTINLVNRNDTVTTTSGSTVTYTTTGDGMTLAVTSDGIIFSGLTTGDTFTIGEGAYKVSAVAPMNPSGELWTGGDYANGITLAQINDATNWTPMITAPDAGLSVDAETLTEDGELIVVDNVDDPTAIYGDLTKSGDAYTLTRPTTANADLTSIAVDGVAIEIAPNYAGVTFTANDSAFSNVTLADAEKSFTLDATNTPSLSDNVSSLTLTAGTIDAAVNQVVTTGNNVITPTAINGDMVIGTATIGGIVQGDTFTLNDKAYVMLNTGLFNDTDNKLVTSGIDDGTLTISDIVETQLLAISNGELDLTTAAAGNSLVVDTVESPANVYGALNKNKNTYKLDKRSDGITSITLPDATSTLTTDIAATVNAPSSSNTYTVNSKVYKANNSALTIASDGTTSTLTDGTINLVNRNDTVTTTSGSTVTYTTTGDGMTLAVTSDGITFSGLTTGDTFTIGDNAYKVSAVAPMNPSGELWTGGDYANGITLAQINDATNWTTMIAAPDAALSVDAETLTEDGELIVVDNVDDPTAIYGDLTKSGDAYTLTRPTTANADLTSIAVDGVAIEIAPNYAGVTFTANDSAFSDVTLTDAEKSFTLDATNTPSLSDNVSSLTLTAGTVEAAVNQVVTTGDNVITPTAINGDMVIGTATIGGIVQGDAFTLNDKAYVMLNTGLFNDTDNKLVTSGIDDGTLTISDIVETQLLAISNGELDLTTAAAGNTLIVDTVESPANVYGALNKNENNYKLDKRSDGITSITLPDATSTLTTDIAATVNAPSSSNTYTVNSKVYKANNSALTIASDGTTSTLTNGTISLTDNEDTVTTTSGSTITYTTTGDGMTVTAANNSVTLNGLTASDTFTVGDNAYRVSQLGFHNDANYLWTSSTDYKDGVTVAEINNADNWTRTVIADNDSLSVEDKTLNDGVTAIVIDSATAATKSLGTLSRIGDTYTLTRDANNKLSAIAVDNTKLAIDNQLADVPVTADGATFTVTANAPYTVDATGNTVAISDDATAIEISTGTITATTNQTVTATPDSGATSVIGQNNGTFNIGGETFAVADNVDSITFGMTNGAADSVRNLEENANVTIDGRTYTAPQDNSTLLFNDADGWYFDGYVPTRYNITIDSNGNVIVDAGVKFTDVVASGQTLPEDGTIKLAVDVNTIPINVTNAGTTAININDINNNPLAENLGAVENVTFDSAGVMVENTSDVAGAVFTIDTGQSFETETATITASADDCAVGVGTNGTSLSVDKAATIDAPVDTALTLGNARYTVNGVYFTSGGTAQASLTSDGVKFDLVNSDVITYNRTNFDGTGNATAEIDKDRGISLTSGASVDGATGKSFNIAGTVTLDANTIDAATATDVTAKSSGYAVANDDVTVTGDDDGYKVNISGGQISGLENIGSASGVTIGGLMSGTIKTDKVGAFTVADKTFIAVGDASVIYGIENGTLTSASDVASVITGDFSDGLTVNNGKLQVTGDDVSLDVSRNNNRKVDGFNDKATLTTADNVIKIEPTGAGEFTFGDHVFKTDDATIAFNLRNSSVIGVDSLENGNLIISQDEHNFIVNAESIDLDEIDSPVTLEIADSGIHSVYGLHSGMDGLDIATVFGVSSATINSKYFEIVGGTLDAIVIDSVPASLYGLESDMTINSAPSVAIRTTENGTFTFGNDVFNINDTVDGVVIFETDENTHVINIGEFEGEVFGDLKDTALNDKEFSTSSDKVTVISDGTDIISLQGLSSGDSISGSLSNATYVMPEGTLNVNDRGYILQGDNDGVSMTGDGLVVVGLDKDASLTVTKGGAYSVNDQDFKAKDGDTFIAGRDYVYIADPNNKPITEKTKIDDIIENLLGKQGSGTVSLSGDSAASVIASGNLDSPMALTLDSDINNADFSNSNNTKRVTLLGGDQNIKFNDEGGNAAYVDKTAKGKKNIELGNGGDVAVNDAPNAKVSIKAGTGADTIVNRNGAKSTVDVKNNGDTTIVPTSGKVTLQNYSNDNNTKIRTFEYSDLKTAIKSNEVKFGDGVMTLGDAVIVFDPNASAVGGTFTNLVDYSGDNQRVGFTHTDGGVLNASTSSDNLILKGNYAESSSDTTKTGASTLISGRGNDTILAGGDDYIDAGAGENQIYITDKNLAGGEGVTILLAGKGKNTVHNFNGGFDGGDAIKVDDISAVKFIFDENGLVMRSGRARITFDSLEPADDLISYSDADVAAPYEIQISDGTNEYNAAVAQEGKDIGVHDSNEANLFYGDNTGLNFSEYTGEVEVNLNQGTGSLDGSAAFFYNINKLQAGSGNSSLIGKAGAKNTLIAGTGNTSMWSAAGRDSMVGNASDEKDGSTMFYYLSGDGRDTITNFGFMTSADGYNADIINITTDNAVTDVYLKGDNVVMQINNSAEDYLTLVDAKGKDFKINNLIAKVDDNNVEFDGIANCYVADSKNSTMSIGADVGNAQIWLDDRATGQHGIYYLGDIKYLDARAATGNDTLVGNDLNNIIYGGAGKNSIWGGFGDSNDTLVGGTGQNTFFFGMQNGKDIATSAKDGDVVDLTTIGLEQIRATTITGGGAKLELTDGSSLEIQGTANVEYRLNDGSRYAADHSSGQWIKK